MSETLSTATFEGVRTVAAHLGVPASWLRAEAEAGRVPCLRIGRQLRLNIAAVQHALLERSASQLAKSESSPTEAAEDDG